MNQIARLTLLGSLLFAVSFCCRSIEAETWTMGTLPYKRSKLGFVMNIQVEAVGGNGYQPIHLSFQSTGTSFLRDRHVEIAINPIYDSANTFQYSYRKSLTLPEGSMAVSKTICVPHYYDWRNVNVELREDGRAVEWGTRDFASTGNLRNGFASQVVTVGIVQPKDAAAQDAPWKRFPDVRTLVTVLGDGPIPAKSYESTGDVNVVDRRLSHRHSIDLAKQVQPAWVQFRPIDESNLPNSWLGYSQLDVILGAAPVIDRIANEQPERIRELESWIAAGGNLWVYASKQGSGTFANSLQYQAIRPEELIQPTAISELLNLDDSNDSSELISNGWNGVTKQSLHYSYQNSGTTMSTRDSALTRLIGLDHPFAELAESSMIADGLTTASLGAGQIIAIESEDPFPGSFQFWKSLAEFAGPTRLHWTERNGVDVPKGNDDYWSWLIRSVGQPPVKSFVLLNLLFAIFIGPICYRFLRRRERLYLLYFAAPCVALLVTCGLFAYAMLVDGVSTKQRTRQLTWIDPVNGYNVCQDRATYYRVFGYGQQVDVSTDTAIYPVRHTPALMGYYARNSNENHLHGAYTDIENRQTLGGGFLPSRSQVQFIATTPIKSEKSIDVDFASAVVSNRLTQTIRQLMVRDKDGNLWSASDLAPSSLGTLQRSTSKDQVFSAILGPEVLPDETEVPTLLTYSWAQNNTVSHRSMLEVRLEEWTKRLPANCFIGIAEIDRDRLGITDATLVDSVHVIMGTLP